MYALCQCCEMTPRRSCAPTLMNVWKLMEAFLLFRYSNLISLPVDFICHHQFNCHKIFLCTYYCSVLEYHHQWNIAVISEYHLRSSTVRLQSNFQNCAYLSPVIHPYLSSNLDFYPSFKAN